MLRERMLVIRYHLLKNSCSLQVPYRLLSSQSMLYWSQLKVQDNLVCKFYIQCQVTVYYSLVYSLLQFSLQFITVQFTVYYSLVYSLLQFSLLIITVQFTIYFNLINNVHHQQQHTFGPMILGPWETAGSRGAISILILTSSSYIE